MLLDGFIESKNGGVYGLWMHLIEFPEHWGKPKILWNSFEELRKEGHWILLQQVDGSTTDIDTIEFGAIKDEHYCCCRDGGFVYKEARIKKLFQPTTFGATSLWLETDGSF